MLTSASMDSPLSRVRTEFRAELPRDLLGHPANVLLGVSKAALQELQALHINTVFDLATSRLFRDARALVEAASTRTSAITQFGRAPSDLVDEARASSTQPESLPTLPLNALQSLSAVDVDALGAALDVETIGDLASYEPHRAAAALLELAFFPDNVVGDDDERPADLVPRSGEYPTERVQYSTLLLDEIPLVEGENVIDLSSADFRPVDLAGLERADAGFTRPAFGALLTFNQSWYAHGLTLGQLLHSTSLAPGESTRIAIIDWTRRTLSSQTESVTEVDDLTNDTSHTRSISEVAQAVASEAQGGFSETNTSSTTHASATSGAMEMSAPLGGLLGGPSGSMGFSDSQATTTSNAASYSNSWGQREISSSMAQNINDRTHQHAHSSRSRRASLVREVSQSEHEEVSTRTLANYNHMHALTIQYYEVVQVFRTEVALAKADRVIYVPFKLADFDDDDTIRRFRPALLRAAVNRTVYQALRDLDVIEIRLDREVRFAAMRAPLRAVVGDGMIERIRVSASVLSASRSSSAVRVTAPIDDESRTEIKSTLGVGQVRSSARVNVRSTLWDASRAASLSGMLRQEVFRRNSTSMFLPNDAVVEGVSIEAGEADLKVVFETLDGNTESEPSGAEPLPLREVRRIRLEGDSADADETASVVLTLNRNGLRFPIELPTVGVVKGSGRSTRLVEVRDKSVDDSLKDHLKTNATHYNSAVFRSLDATQIALLLSNYTVKINGRTVPVSQATEPRPYAVIGNYLAFRMNADAATDDAWASWLDERGIRVGHTESDLVPLGTGGTFAEAVLGRSNSAEKLDMTRFWNWQDSPIPLEPTEIAAIQTGSRVTPEDTRPSPLGAPVVSITSPTTLPDPTGMAGVLSAIQNGSMFRDMSGLEATIGLAQAALEASSAGAATAGQQAGENMNNLLKANTERQRIAGQLISNLASTLLGGGGGKSIPAGSHSEQGAKVNYFDKTKSPAGGGSSSGGGSGSPSPSGESSASSGGGAASRGSGFAPSSAGYSTNPAIMAATWGDSTSPSNAFRHIADIVGDVATPTQGGAPATTYPKPAKGVAKTLSEKTDTDGIADTLLFDDPPMSEPMIPGLNVANWRMSTSNWNVHQYGGARVKAVDRNLDMLDLLVLHETGSSAWSNPDPNLSVHVHIDRDGSVHQHNRFQHHCQHIGVYNSRSIGIEHVNIPYLSADPANGRAFQVPFSPFPGKDFLSFPPEDQLEASVKTIDAIRNRMNSIAAWYPQVIQGPVLFDDDDPEAMEEYWLMYTRGHDWFRLNGIYRPFGIVAHSALVGHDDAALLPLYYRFRNDQGMSDAQAVVAIGALVTDSSRYVTKADSGINLHLLRL
ncbi:MAG: N-acetylmuramoyl-L-alanine amidase [Myxococcota bacterium]